MTYHIRPATHVDLHKVHKRDTAYATKAWAIDYNGKLAAVAGLEFHPKQTLVFSSMIEGRSYPKKAIWRCAKEIMGKIIGFELPLIVAICDEKFMNSARFLKRLGFKKAGMDRGREVYIWQRQH